MMRGLVWLSLWEAPLFLAALALAWTFLRDTISERRGVFVAAVLAIKLLLAALIPQTIGLLGSTPSAGLLAGYALTILALAVVVWQLFAGGRAHPRLEPDAGARSPTLWLAGGACVALALPIAASFTPIVEWDSQRMGAAMAEMAGGLRSPLDFPFNYSAIWESSVVAPYVMASSTVYFPFVELQVTALFTWACFALARQSGLSTTMSALLALLGALSGHLWGAWPSGAGTIKNDAFYATGLLLFILGALRLGERGVLDRSGLTLAVCGATFATTKSTGPVIVALWLAVFAAIWWSELRRRPRAAALGGGAIVGTTFVAGGIYYLANWIRFGSPFYPIRMDIGPIHLPGTDEIEGTSLFEHVTDTDAWLYFFGLHAPPGWPSWPATEAGPLFVLAFVVSLAAACVVVARLARQSGGNPLSRRTLVFLGVATVVGWLVFMRSPFVAALPHDERGPLIYLSNQNTLRYALAQVQLSWLVSVLALTALGRAGAISAGVLVGLEIVGRLLSIYVVPWTFLTFQEAFAPGAPIWSVGPYWLSAAVLSAILLVVVRRRTGALAALAAFAAFAFVLAPTTFRTNMAYGGFFNAVVDRAGLTRGLGSVVTLTDGAPPSCPLWSNVFAATGSFGQFRFIGSRTLAEVARSVSDGSPPAAIVATCQPPRQLSDDAVEALADQLAPAGYQLRAVTQAALLFLRTPQDGRALAFADLRQSAGAPLPVAELPSAIRIEAPKNDAPSPVMEGVWPPDATEGGETYVAWVSPHAAFNLASHVRPERLVIDWYVPASNLRYSESGPLQIAVRVQGRLAATLDFAEPFSGESVIPLHAIELPESEQLRIEITSSAQVVTTNGDTRALSWVLRSIRLE